MALKIELKRSAVPGKVPTTGSLELGELAINTYDGKVFLKKDTLGVQSIIEIASTSGSVVSASYAINAGNANTSTSSSYSLNSTSASYAITASYALTASFVGYNYFQTSSSNIWIINHNLNNQYPLIQVYGNDNVMILPMSISGSNNNTSIITFSYNTTGYVRII